MTGGPRDARSRRHQQAWNAELTRQGRGMHRSGAAEGEEREIARIVAARQRHQTDGAGHAIVGDAQDRRRRLGPAQSQPAADLLPDALLHGLERHRVVDGQELRGIEAAQNQVRIGDGRPLAAAAVADRTRPRALQGIRRAPDAKTMVSRLGRKETLLEPCFKSEQLIELGLDEDEYRLLKLVDGKRTLYEVCVQGPRGAAENGKMLYAFHILQLIRIAQPASGQQEPARTGETSSSAIKIRFTLRPLLGANGTRAPGSSTMPRSGHSCERAPIPGGRRRRPPYSGASSWNRSAVPVRSSRRRTATLGARRRTSRPLS